MAEEAGIQLVLNDRRVLTLAGVLNVASFDEREIALETTLGYLSLKGEGLHISQLNLDRGTITAQGLFNALVYQDNKTGRPGSRGRSVVSRLLR